MIEFRSDHACIMHKSKTGWMHALGQPVSARAWPAAMLGRLRNIVPCSFVLNSCRGGAKKKNGDKLEVRSQILLLAARLRGPVAYGLAIDKHLHIYPLHFDRLLRRVQARLITPVSPVTPRRHSQGC